MPSPGSSNPKIGTCTETNGLIFKTTGPGSPWMAQLSQNSTNHSPPSQEGPQNDFGGQPRKVLTPHRVQDILEVKGQHWLAYVLPGSFATYARPYLKGGSDFKPCYFASSATREGLEHTYVKTLEQVYYSQMDLQGTLWKTQMRNASQMAAIL